MKNRKITFLLTLVLLISVFIFISFLSLSSSNINKDTTEILDTVDDINNELENIEIASIESSEEIKNNLLEQQRNNIDSIRDNWKLYKELHLDDIDSVDEFIENFICLQVEQLIDGTVSNIILILDENEELIYSNDTSEDIDYIFEILPSLEEIDKQSGLQIIDLDNRNQEMFGDGDKYYFNFTKLLLNDSNYTLYIFSGFNEQEMVNSYIKDSDIANCLSLKDEVINITKMLEANIVNELTRLRVVAMIFLFTILLLGIIIVNKLYF